MQHGFEDHYATLGLAPDARADGIRRARNRLLKLHHPDRASGSVTEATRRTIEILRAAEVLLDPEERAAYDRRRAHASRAPLDGLGRTALPCKG